ncbi:hypothetical protein SLS58_008737 [Diplodia intermedia]|uniref:Uncharacterized protein n=1 Tax=Diplodia intermedia TaxID=856260 RepID=A0ABR3TGV2_9PEZI
MSPNLQRSGNREAKPNERGTESMRDFSRTVTARLSTLIQTGYDTRHGSAANPIVLDDSDDEVDNNKKGANSSNQPDNAAARNVRLVDAIELDSLPPPNTRPAMLDCDNKNALDDEKAPVYHNFSPVPRRTEYLADPHWPCLTSNMRNVTLTPNSVLPVSVCAPPGPTEAHFVYADEREEYLRRCPPHADFSMIVFMPTNADGSTPSNTNNGSGHDGGERGTTPLSTTATAGGSNNSVADMSEPESPSSTAANYSGTPATSVAATYGGSPTPTTPTTPPPTPPPATLPLLSPSEAEHMRNLFIAKGHALRASRHNSDSRTTTTTTTPAPSNTSTASPSSTSIPPPHHQQYANPNNQLPHLDPDDDSRRAHYAQCEVCRGIRRRAVPDGHAYWRELGEAVERAAERAREKAAAGNGTQMQTRSRSIREAFEENRRVLRSRNRTGERGGGRGGRGG